MFFDFILPINPDPQMVTFFGVTIWVSPRRYGRVPRGTEGGQDGHFFRVTILLRDSAQLLAIY